MSNYSLLLNFMIKHEYFADAPCTAFSFESEESSAKFLKNHGLVLKIHPDGASVYFDQDNRKALTQPSTNAFAPFVLWFRLFPADPEMSTYTVPGTPQENRVLLFSGDNPAIDEKTGRQLLTRGDTVSEEDFSTLPAYDPEERDQNKIDLFNATTRGNLRVRPIAVVRIEVTDWRSRQYLIRFKSRETFWRYCLLGDLADPTHTIVDTQTDTQKMVVFGKGVDTTTDDRRAITFTSNRKIAMRQFSDKHFQLISTRSVEPLIGRLPVASISGLFPDTINGQKTLVSNIYIN